MPIPNHSVLQALPTAGKVVTGPSTDYQITMQATGGPFTVAFAFLSVRLRSVRNRSNPSAELLPDGPEYHSRDYEADYQSSDYSESVVIIGIKEQQKQRSEIKRSKERSQRANHRD